MKNLFSYQPFNAQLLRALNYTYAGGADIGECFSTAERITDGDPSSWCNEWFKTAEYFYSQARYSHTSRCFVSARESFLRASNYYRTAFFFLYKHPIDPKLLRCFEMHKESFDRAMELTCDQYEKVEIHFEGSKLPGYFYKQDSIPRPTIIANTGYDGTHQENYFAIAKPALERGYNVITFDGPGQGECLIKKRLYMRYDWEKAVTAVVDYLLTRSDVIPNKIVLIGQSWGGYLCPRAAAFENRLAALIANPGQYQALLRIESFIPQVHEMIQQGKIEMLSKLANQLMQDKLTQLVFESKMFVHGITNPGEMIMEWTKYDLKDIAEKVRCPTLVMDSEDEKFSKGQAKMLFEALKCPKDYLFFKAKDGAGEHCQMGAIAQFYSAAFDWLSHKIPVNTHAFSGQ